MTKDDDVKALIEAAGGKVDEIGTLPDGSGFATASFPLPKDHWLYAAGDNETPMPLRIGLEESLFVRTKAMGSWASFSRQQLAEQVRAAARYAIRCATMNGKEPDFDPDAMVQGFVVGMLGYWTRDGRSSS